MARRDIAFDAEGVALRRWFYPAQDASGRRPTVVMAHGFSAVKEMYLDAFAEVFAAAGLNALVFDNRNFGASDGEPPGAFASSDSPLGGCAGLNALDLYRADQWEEQVDVPVFISDPPPPTSPRSVDGMSFRVDGSVHRIDRLSRPR